MLKIPSLFCIIILMVLISYWYHIDPGKTAIISFYLMNINFTWRTSGSLESSGHYLGTTRLCELRVLSMNSFHFFLWNFSMTFDNVYSTVITFSTLLMELLCGKEKNYFSPLGTRDLGNLSQSKVGSFGRLNAWTSVCSQYMRTVWLGLVLPWQECPMDFPESRKL